jgi:hypothetical protein
VSEHFQSDLERLKDRRVPNNLARRCAVTLCRDHAGLSHAEIAALFRMPSSNSDRGHRDIGRLTEQRLVATTGFSRMVEILAAHFDQAKPAEARKRAMATAAAMIGAVTMSRLLTTKSCPTHFSERLRKALRVREDMAKAVCFGRLRATREVPQDSR